MTSFRFFLIAPVAAALLAPPLAMPLVAQRGAPPARPPAQPAVGAVRVDTIRQQGAFALDFQNQELQLYWQIFYKKETNKLQQVT